MSMLLDAEQIWLDSRVVLFSFFVCILLFLYLIFDREVTHWISRDLDHDRSLPVISLFYPYCTIQMAQLGGVLCAFLGAFLRLLHRQH